MRRALARTQAGTRIAALAIAGWAALAAPAARAGNWTGGGGDVRAMQFIEIARYLTRTLPGLRLPEMASVPVDRIAALLAPRQIRVTSVTTPLTLNGVSVHAINYPAQRYIEFDANYWDSIPVGSRRAALVWHELCGLAGIADAQYQVSGVLYENVGLREMLDRNPVALASTESDNTNLLVNCSIFRDGVLAAEINPIGPRRGTIELPRYDRPIAARVTSFWELRELPVNGRRLTVMVDTLDRPPFMARPRASAIRSPVVRVLAGYGNVVFDFQGEVLASQDYRVTPGFEAVLSVPVPQSQVEVRCHASAAQL